MSRRILAILFLVLALAIPTNAAAATIVAATTSGVADDGTLPVAVYVTGYAPGERVPVTVAAHDAQATWACVTPGGHVQDQQTATASPDTAFSYFTADASGTVRGTVSLAPPASTLDCSGQRTPVLEAVSYSGVAASADGAGSVGVAGGPFTRGAWSEVHLADGALD